MKIIEKWPIIFGIIIIIISFLTFGVIYINSINFFYPLVGPSIFISSEVRFITDYLGSFRSRRDAKSRRRASRTSRPSDTLQKVFRELLVTEGSHVTEIELLSREIKVISEKNIRRQKRLFTFKMVATCFSRLPALKVLTICSGRLCTCI